MRGGGNENKMKIENIPSENTITFYKNNNYDCLICMGGKFYECRPGT